MRRLFLSVFIMAAAAAPSALAAGLSATQTVERQVVSETAEGERIVSWQKAEKAVPGDVMRYAMQYSNGGAAKAENVVLVVPVPDAMRYVESSASVEGAAVTFSADGGKTFASRGELAVNAEGRKVSAEADDITHVRWLFPTGIGAGQSGSVSFEAVLK